ncbi:MAG: histidine phosphatase family protein [Silicimonas sp.]|nr:histidine phosphatase family protein [Silicimonas sp.]
MASGAELILIRHGATVAPGRLNGRTDVALATRPGPVALVPDGLWVSPATRARETAAGLFPGLAMREDARLWEQDFGDWDGRDYSDLPDLGEMSREALADHAGGGGESFRAMVTRVRPALEEAAEIAWAGKSRMVIVAHAGTVRAALALALEDTASALAFEVGHLAATRLRCHASGFAVAAVNEPLS